ncbi:MAG: hypothetical protein JRI23_07125 [Deltaproteobacteria bacterium]|jgi:hypothetical protein|nr:hypothetical protein [Deltaproteobacteria bacterium]MBW2531364.1 hypothetical protein [Deltaproteobacteria bacterium]
MRSLIIGSCALLAIGSLIAVGCSSDDSEGGGGGSSAGGTSTTPTGSGTGGGGTVECTEITSNDFAYLGTGLLGLPFYYGGGTDPAIGEALDDLLYFQIYDPELTGAIDLSSGDQANFGTCNACLLVIEDAPEEGDPARIYFQQSGTVDLGSTTPYYIAGSMSDVTLVEVTINPDTGESTPVSGGQCLTISTLSFDIQPPVAGWTCDPLYYDGGDQDICDCECGVIDPDCSIADIDIYPCYEGQTCNDTSAECEGVPTAWTCAGEDFDAGDECHCGCGVPDPDCEDTGATVLGCDSGTTCNAGTGVCVDDGWTCNEDFYGSSDGCDCACGVYDPDCEDDEAPVYNCDESNHTGVCLPDGTCETS